MINLKAHPLFPILATQMDDDIGIWMPLHGKPPDKESLDSVRIQKQKYLFLYIFPFLRSFFFFTILFNNIYNF